MVHEKPVKLAEKDDFMTDNWSSVWEGLSDDEIQTVMERAPEVLEERERERERRERRQQRLEAERDERKRAREIVDGADRETVEAIAQRGLEVGSHLWNRIPIERFEGIRGPALPSADAIEQAAQEEIRRRQQRQQEPARGIQAGAPVRQEAAVIGSLSPLELAVLAALAVLFLR